MNLCFLVLILMVFLFGVYVVVVENVNVYFGCYYDIDLVFYDQFMKEIGIKVNFIEGKVDEFIEWVLNEGWFSLVDVFIIVDVGWLWWVEQ